MISAMQLAQVLRTKFVQLIARKADQPKVEPLYIQRKLTPECAAKFIEHFKAQGFDKVLAPEELHVTIVYSKEPVDWASLEPDDSDLDVHEGKRKIQPLGDKGAVVMLFDSERLQARHRAWELNGASWDYDEYRPHVTITYKNPIEDLKQVKPYLGPLEFGPEILEPINTEYAEKVVEKHELAQVLKTNPYHAADGKFTSKELRAYGHPGIVGYKKSMVDHKLKALGEGDIPTEKVFYNPPAPDMHLAMLTSKDVPKTSAFVPSDKIVPTQEQVEAQGLRNYADGKGGATDRPWAILHKGKYYVQDGHHRLAVDMMTRDSTSMTKLDVVELVGMDDDGNPKYKKYVAKADFGKALKANPYHAADGKFTSKDKDADGKADTKDSLMAQAMARIANGEDMVSVMTWLGEENERSGVAKVPQDLEVYHGTSSAALTAIQKDGLSPGASKGGDAWWGVNREGSIHTTNIADRKASVYFTTDSEYATAYAKMAAEVTGSDPLVLKIKIPGSNRKDLVVDEEGPNGLRIKGKVPPEWISGVVKKDEGLVLHAVLMTSGAAKKQELAKTLKFNPYHAADGTFSTQDAAKFVSFTGVFAGVRDRLKARQPLVLDDHEDSLQVVDKGKDAVLVGQAEKWCEGLSDEEYAAVSEYTGSGHSLVNTHLRHGLSTGPDVSDFVRKKAHDMQTRLDSALAKSSLPVDVKVYRGITPELADRLVSNGSMIDRGFVSTTLAPEVATSFGRTLLEMTLEKGTKAAYVSGSEVGLRGELEVLLPRGHEFEYVGERTIKRRYGEELRVIQVRRSRSKVLDGKVQYVPPPPSADDELVSMTMKADPKKFSWSRDDVEFTKTKKVELAQVLKRNPYHDEGGKFTSKDKDADGKADTHIEGLKHVKGVGWTDADGKTLDADTAARMKALRVPPAWTNVRLSKDPNSSLQATGTDSKGRKQYLYSAAHSIAAAAEKFKRLSSFNEALSGIRSKLSDRMKSSPDDTTAVIRMIQRTGVRVGSDNETGGKHKAYGATTLLGQHVRLEGDTVHLDFPGKHGQPNTRTFKDKLLADYIRQKNAGPEDRLFQTSDKKTRDVMKALTGTDDFSPKDFRTWHGTAQALKALRDMPEPTTEAERKKQRTEVAKRVSSFLNNTPAVALESYIDPAVFDRPRRVVKAEITEDQWLIEIMDEFCQTTHYDQDVRMAGEPEDD